MCLQYDDRESGENDLLCFQILREYDSAGTGDADQDPTDEELLDALNKWAGIRKTAPLAVREGE